MVLMNPPFGTKRPGADITFFACGARRTCCDVYSIQKPKKVVCIGPKSTKWKVTPKVIVGLRYDISHTLRIHRFYLVDVAVDVLRFD